MNKMPYAIKQKLRQINKVAQKSFLLKSELCDMLEEYGLETEIFTASLDKYEYPMQTEALAQIEMAEFTSEGLESGIQEIENVFLYYVNKRKSDICE